MKVHEYQGKEVLARYNVAVPRGILVTEVEAARAAAEELGGRVVVKAHIHAARRGQARGLKPPATPAHAVPPATHT
ncbi:MAG: succinate--CoA ligase subunit beta, partial [Deltaproteobacteria bacterium]